MITVEDLRNSLRAQLGALVELYERDAGIGAGGGRGRRSNDAASPRLEAGPTAIPGFGEDDSGRAMRIETCLVDFEAALRAAARAEVVREAAQAEALSALERCVALQRDAVLARRGVERALIASRSPAGRRPRDTASAVERSRSAAHAAERAARGADAVARRRRATAETASRTAMAALLAAIQADPARGNPGFDPAVAGAARTLAERAARDAEALAGDGQMRDGQMRDGRGVVVRLTAPGTMSDDRIARDPTQTRG